MRSFADCIFFSWPSHWRVFLAAFSNRTRRFHGSQGYYRFFFLPSFSGFPGTEAGTFLVFAFFLFFFFICRRRFRAGARTKRNARSAAAPSVPFGVVTEFPYRVFVGSALFSAGRPANTASFTGPVLMSSCSTGAPWVTTRFIGRFRFRRRGPSALEVLGR